MITVLTFGTFDHLHQGHKYLLREAGAKGDLFVVVARDDNVKHIKGRSPDQDEDTRADVISRDFPDATVVLGHESDYRVPLEEIEPDLIVMGYDQKLPPGLTEEDLPCEVVRLDAFEPEKYKSSIVRKGE